MIFFLPLEIKICEQKQNFNLDIGDASVSQPRIYETPANLNLIFNATVLKKLREFHGSYLFNKLSIRYL